MSAAAPATLLPCPFCGAQACAEPVHYLDIDGSATHIVSCPNPEFPVVVTAFSDTAAEAAAKWNTRSGCSMNTAQTIQNEILALRRIAAFDGYDWPNLGAGMWDFDRYFTIELDEGELQAVVDFYSQDFYRVHPDGNGEFDSDTWEDEKMILSTKVVTREQFKNLYRMCRGLLSGKTIVLADGKSTSRDLYLAQVREGVAV